MALGDTFEFDGAAYRSKVKLMNTEELRQREIIKTRQQVSSYCGMASGLCFSVVTAGTSLLGSALSFRRGRVANKKLEIVQDELRRRGVDLYELRKRDVFIPTATSILTMGIFVGGTELLLDTTSIGVATAGSSSSITHILNMPATDFASHMTGGAETQVTQVTSMGFGGAHETLLATNTCIIHAQQAGADTAALALGMKGAQGLEIAGLQQAVGPLDKKFLGLKKNRTKV